MEHDTRGRRHDEFLSKDQLKREVSDVLEWEAFFRAQKDPSIERPLILKEAPIWSIEDLTAFLSYLQGRPVVEDSIKFRGTEVEIYLDSVASNQVEAALGRRTHPLGAQIDLLAKCDWPDDLKLFLEANDGSRLTMNKTLHGINNSSWWIEFTPLIPDLEYHFVFEDRRANNCVDFTR
ncbi:MAG: hypothetical protein ACK5GN_07975 [Pseudomonadota bacterium]|jgi:hypothetical protein